MMNAYETVYTLCYLIGISVCLGDSPKGCDGYYKESTGNITSPNYPAPYPDDTDCTYVIGVQSLSYIRITFNDIQLENVYDCIEYGIGRLVDNQTKLKRICSETEAPSQFKVETDSGIWFHLVTDSGVGYRGFSLTWSIEDYCGGLHTENEGILISPQHPDLYPHNLDCVYVIKLNHTSHIRLTTETIQLEMDYDRLIYGIGGKVEINKQGYFTGQHETPLVWDVIASTVWLHFISDYAVEYAGFNISWQASALPQVSSTVMTSLDIRSSMKTTSSIKSSDSTTVSMKSEDRRSDSRLGLIDVARRRQERQTDIVLKITAGGVIVVIAVILLVAIGKPYCRRSQPAKQDVPRITVDMFNSRESPSGISMDIIPSSQRERSNSTQRTSFKSSIDIIPSSQRERSNSSPRTSLKPIIKPNVVIKKDAGNQQDDISIEQQIKHEDILSPSIEINSD